MAKFNDEAVRAALSGRKAVLEYPLPGAESIKVGVRMLADAEVDSARLTAQAYVVTNKCELLVDPEFFDRALNREIISRAFVDAENHDHAFFGSMKDVAEMDPAQVKACFELYRLHQMQMDPYAHCPAEEVAQLVELLGKSPDKKAILSLFDGDTLQSFVLSLVADRLAK